MKRIVIGLIMKRIVIGLILCLSVVGLADTSYEWQRRECVICGKTIWEKVEYSDTITWDAGAGGILFVENYVSLTDEPRRTESVNLVYTAIQQVCPTCERKYATSFKETMRKTMHDFIAKAIEAEGERRKIVAEQNTQEEVRRVESQIKTMTEQLQSLTQQLETLKSSATVKE